MSPTQFVQKWQRLNSLKLSEKTGYQVHFNDLCDMIGHPKPLEQLSIPEFAPENFTFEKRAAMVGAKGGHGWADVWKNRAFAFEYKKPHGDLDAAYGQLLRYHDDLGNVPVLATCDFDVLHFHVKRTNCKTIEHKVRLADIPGDYAQQIIYDVFRNVDGLQTGEEIDKATRRIAADLAHIAVTMSTPERYGDIPQRVALFLDRLAFTLFAEDCSLLPRGLFRSIIEDIEVSPSRTSRRIHNLWRAMQHGEDFGSIEVRYFNGSLFDEVLDEAPLLMHDYELAALRRAANHNWKEMDASIFGTLFEAALDPIKRAQMGAHYTSREDIETLVEPVIMHPLRALWDEKKNKAEQELASGNDEAATHIIANWLEHLSSLKVLDPACGSGNFLYIAQEKLLDLEYQACKWGNDYLAQPFVGRIRPHQFCGLEKSFYAYDLARIVIWIGFLQWQGIRRLPILDNPVLQKVKSIEWCDALFNPETGEEKLWPEADFIVGNPPFIGGSSLWRQLGRDYQTQLWKVFDGRVSGGADFVCYWFEKAREQIANGKTKRVGLVATQAIRGGANREVLKRIKQSGDIFFAVSDRDWRVDGAAVNISLVGFDDGGQQERFLDGEPVGRIFANLTAEVDVTSARPLTENQGICFRPITKSGAFDLPETEALVWLSVPNPNQKLNSDVLRPWINGAAILQRNSPSWIIDTGLNMSLEEFELYERPHFQVDSLVRPERLKNNRAIYRENWWRFSETRPSMQRAIAGMKRIIVTPSIAKHRIFVWLTSEIVPDNQLYVFARTDDYFFGVLHSKPHELWALRTGTRLETRPRYTPTTCFDTFAFPNPTAQQEQSIAEAAAHLNALRENWLYPPEWTKKETFEFRASENGPWRHRLVPDSIDSNGIGTAQWTRLVPIASNRPVQDVRYDPRLNDFRNYAVTTKDALSHRTLTNLYNNPPAWLQSAHRALDEAVFAAYGWPADLEDEEILERLLALNLERAGQTVESESQPAEVVVEVVAPDTSVGAILDEARDSWRDAVGFYLTYHLHKHQSMGRTKLQKLLYLAEATYQLPLGGDYERQAAGPLDTNMIYPFEQRATENEWLEVVPWQNGELSGFNYALGANTDDAYRLSTELLGEHTKELDELIRVFGSCNTETAEKVATLYAAWNDLLLQGKTPSEKDILDEVLNNWHESKRKIPRPIWRNQLDWMKREKFTPRGHGTLTLQLSKDTP